VPGESRCASQGLETEAWISSVSGLYWNNIGVFFEMKAIVFAVLVPIVVSALTATAKDLEVIPGCSLVHTDWADGDSFSVKFPDGVERTIRLYGADCFEWHVTDSTDARRLRAQRRYFGISDYGAGSAESIAKAKEIGAEAALFVRKLLKSQFTVTTAFADARGDGKYKRYYGFVETADGIDLGDALVEAGLARAFGVYRARSKTQSAESYRERLKDLEMRAAKLEKGGWKYTNWDSLPEERKEERDEEDSLAAATDGAVELEKKSINPNTAPRDLLMKLPGIGEVSANRIIEGRGKRKYAAAEDLEAISGIGTKTIERIRDYLIFTSD